MGRWQKRQLAAVAVGSSAFLASLGGGVWKSVWLARGGLMISVLCILAIVLFGVMAARENAKS